MGPAMPACAAYGDSFSVEYLRQCQINAEIANNKSSMYFKEDYGRADMWNQHTPLGNLHSVVVEGVGGTHGRTEVEGTRPVGILGWNNDLVYLGRHISDHALGIEVEEDSIDCQRSSSGY